MKWDWCDHSLLQLKSERSHRVLCTIASVASVSMRFRSNERGTRVKDRAKNGAFFTLVPFLSPSKPKIPYLCLSLLRNQMETLVTQAMCTIKGTESMLFCYTRNTNESNCELFVLLTAIVTLLAILTIQHGIILPQHLLQKHKKLNEKRSNYSKSRDCLSMETITLANKAGVSYRYKLLGS